MIYQRKSASTQVLTGQKGNDVVIQGINTKIGGDTVKTFEYNPNNHAYYCKEPGQYIVNLMLLIESDVDADGFQSFIFGLKNNEDFRHGIATHFIYDTNIDSSPGPSGGPGLVYSVIDCTFNIDLQRGDFLYFIFFQNEYDSPISILGGSGEFESTLTIAKIPVIQRPLNSWDYNDLPVIESFKLGTSITPTGFGIFNITGWDYDGILFNYESNSSDFTVNLSGTYIICAYFSVAFVDANAQASTGLEAYSPNKINKSILGTNYLFNKDLLQTAGTTFNCRFTAIVNFNYGDILRFRSYSNTKGIYIRGIAGTTTALPASAGSSITPSFIRIIKY